MIVEFLVMTASMNLVLRASCTKLIMLRVKVKNDPVLMPKVKLVPCTFFFGSKWSLNFQNQTYNDSTVY